MKFGYLIEPPFNFADEAGHVTGCDVELARHVLGALGIHGFEPVETEFASLLPGLQDGRWRMTTGLFGTAERRKHAHFSRPIWALPDGLLVRSGNPKNLSGYRSVAARRDLRLAVIRDQFQHCSAVELGVADDQISIFEAYAQAARAVRDGQADAYASVGRAHGGFIEQNPDWPVELVLVPAEEKPPAFGSFAVGLDDAAFLSAVDAELSKFLGSAAHRNMAARFGFLDTDVDLVCASGRFE
ncbi:MAG: transporter substrate-binding domain-containing protein [Pseudomonadota bacterium]